MAKGTKNSGKFQQVVIGGLIVAIVYFVAVMGLIITIFDR